MVGRVKFEVQKWNGEWRTTYCRVDLLDVNRLLFLCYGFNVRIDGIAFTGSVAQAA